MSRNFVNKIYLLKYFQFVDDAPPHFILGIMTLIVGAHGCYAYNTQKNDQIIVTNKYMFSRNGYSDFMIVDTNNRHYNMNNSFWFWKWNSVEDWNNVKPNDVLLVKFYGIRIPIIGVFPNIVNSQILGNPPNIMSINQSKINEYIRQIKEPHVI